MKKIHCHITAALLVLVLIFTSTAAAFAVDTDYSGELDGATNLPAASTASSYMDRVALTPTMFFDFGTHDFAYPVDNSLTEIHASVADGMVVSESVSVNPGGDSSVIIFCNGEESTENNFYLHEVGNYVVSYRSGGSSTQIFSFTIVGPTTNAIDTFVPPDGFYITAATRDGEDIFSERYSLDMKEEGQYHVEYECVSTDFVYSFDTAIDRTPPALEFSGRIDQQQRVHSALRFSGLEEGDSVVLLQDAVQVEPEYSTDGTGTIRNSGNYVMRVYDAAGNLKEYKFTIMVYLNAGAWLFVLMVLAVIAAVVIYVIVKRKRLKIG